MGRTKNRRNTRKRQAAWPLGRQCILCGNEAEESSFLCFLAPAPLALALCFACRDANPDPQKRADAVVRAWNELADFAGAEVLH